MGRNRMNSNHANRQQGRGLIFALALVVCLVTVAVAMRAKPQAKGAAQTQTQATDAQGAPMYRVDPFWPKRLLNRGAAADGDEIGGGDDPPRIACCVRGPEAIELDPEGNVVHAWGGPGYIP